METVQDVLGTKREILPCPLPGVLGLEAAVVNAFSPGDTVVVPVFGETGERWAAIAEAFGLSVIRLGGYGGEAPSPEDLRLLLWTREGTVRGVLLPHVERTTGLFVDLENFGNVCRHFGVLCIAEVGESFGVFPLALDHAGIDLAVVCEPLGFENLVFLAIGKRAWEARESARCPRFALDFLRIREWAKGEVPFSFRERLEVLRGMGKEAVWERRKSLAERFREEAKTLGFRIAEWDCFPSVTVVMLPEGARGEQLLSLLQSRGIRSGWTSQGRSLWIRHGDTLEDAEISRILELLGEFLGKV